MKYKDIEELYKDLLTNAEVRQKEHSEQMEKELKELLEFSSDVQELLADDYKNSECGRYELTLKLFNIYEPLLSDGFKNQLVEILNEYKLNDMSLESNFFTVYKMIELNYTLKDMYKNSEPYREDKYNEKIYRQLSKKQNEFRRATPQQHLELFSDRTRELFQNFQFDHYSTTERNKTRDLNIFINELIEVILCDNYIKNFKTMRVTQKTKEFIDFENKIQELKVTTHKNYGKIIQKPTTFKK